MNEVLNKYITNNYHYLKGICKDCNSSAEFEDVFHECLMYMMKKPSDEVNSLIERNEFNKYFIRVFKLNSFSPTSPYQFKYNKLQYTFIFHEILEIVEDDINKYADLDISGIVSSLNINFINKLIFLEYLNKKVNDRSYSFRKMSIEGEISEKILADRFTKVKKELKKIIS